MLREPTLLCPSAASPVPPVAVTHTTAAQAKKKTDMNESTKKPLSYVIQIARAAMPFFSSRPAHPSVDELGGSTTASQLARHWREASKRGGFKRRVSKKDWPA